MAFFPFEAKGDAVEKLGCDFGRRFRACLFLRDARFDSNPTWTEVTELMLRPRGLTLLF